VHRARVQSHAHSQTNKWDMGDDMCRWYGKRRALLRWGIMSKNTSQGAQRVAGRRKEHRVRSSLVSLAEREATKANRMASDKHPCFAPNGLRFAGETCSTVGHPGWPATQTGKQSRQLKAALRALAGEPVHLVGTDPARRNKLRASKETGSL
jgi:hypothetical protein